MIDGKETKGRLNLDFVEGLTESAKELIRTCPNLINRLASNLDRTFETLAKDDTVLEPIEIKHVEYTLDECGRNQ